MSTSFTRVIISCNYCGLGINGRLERSDGEKHLREFFAKNHEDFNHKVTITVGPSPHSYQILTPRILREKIKEHLSRAASGKKPYKGYAKRPVHGIDAPYKSTKSTATSNAPLQPPAKSANSMGGNVKANTPKRSRFDKWSNRF